MTRPRVPESELSWRFTPSSGPGGQHANRSATRAELVWNLEGSRAFGERDKARLRAALRSRLDSAGNVRVAAEEHRSQLRNREEARRRLESLVARALAPRRRRVATEPSPASRERRLQAKRRRAEVKRLRRGPDPTTD